MKNPMWIRVFGWICLLLIAFALSGWLLGSQLNWSPEFSAICWLVFFASIPLFCIWALASAVNSLMTHKAKVSAAEMAKHFARADATGYQPDVQVRGRDKGSPRRPTSPLGLN